MVRMFVMMHACITEKYFKMCVSQKGATKPVSPWIVAVTNSIVSTEDVVFSVIIELERQYCHFLFSPVVEGLTSIWTRKEILMKRQGQGLLENFVLSSASSIN